MTENAEDAKPAATDTPAGSTDTSPGPEAATDAGPGAALADSEVARITDDVIAAIKTVYDPEIPADIYEIGLIYRIELDEDKAVTIDMTLTTPNCPSAQELPIMVENAVASVAGVREAKVNIVWDPPWDPSRMSDEARSVLNMW